MTEEDGGCRSTGERRQVSENVIDRRNEPSVYNVRDGDEEATREGDREKRGNHRLVPARVVGRGVERPVKVDLHESSLHQAPIGPPNPART